MLTGNNIFYLLTIMVNRYNTGYYLNDIIKGINIVILLF